VRFIGSDVLALANIYNSAGEILTVLERRTLPGPFLEAWDLYRAEHRAMKAHVIKQAAKDREG
jgi:hypothetical protein